jgi:hypothetical protein
MLNEINRDEVLDRLTAWIVAQMDHIQLRTPVVEACIA